MEQLELRMHHRHLDQRVNVVDREVAFEGFEMVEQLQRRRGHEGRLFDLAALGPEPVLDDPELPRRLVRAAHAVHQDFVHRPDQREGEGPLGQGLRRQGQGLAVIDDLLDVLDLLPLEFHPRLVFEDFVDRGLSPFDLRREDRFPVGERREHHSGVDDALEQTVIASQGGVGRADLADQTGMVEIRQRQGPRDVGTHSGRLRARQAADVDLAGDGGGDQGGPAFLEEVDGSLGFGSEGGRVSSPIVANIARSALLCKSEE